MNTHNQLSRICLGAALIYCAGVTHAESSSATVSAAINQDGLLVHSVSSPYQRGTTTIRVLMPDNVEPKRKRSILFVLPVEAGDEGRYGDGLLEIKKADLHNKHDLICVAPTFSHLPWYADHPSDPEIRQESYFLKVVVPYVERHYRMRDDHRGRLLLGFSKSGWGAWSLLLRHPKLFGRAAVWDAPLTKMRPNQFGMQSIFGTQENFQSYQVTTLLKQQSNIFRRSNRLVLAGYGNFRDHQQQAHRLLDELEFKHSYRDGPFREHHWGSGWLPDVVGLLVKEPSSVSSHK